MVQCGPVNSSTQRQHDQLSCLACAFLLHDLIIRWGFFLCFVLFFCVCSTTAGKSSGNPRLSDCRQKEVGIHIGKPRPPEPQARPMARPQRSAVGIPRRCGPQDAHHRVCAGLRWNNSSKIDARQGRGDRGPQVIARSSTPRASAQRQHQWFFPTAQRWSTSVWQRACSWHPQRSQREMALGVILFKIVVSSIMFCRVGILCFIFCI